MNNTAPGMALINSVRACFRGSFDFRQHAAAAGGDGAQAVLCYLDSLISNVHVSELVLRPFTDPERFGGVAAASEAARIIMQGGVFCAVHNLRHDAESIVADLLNGHCALIFKSESIGSMLFNSDLIPPALSEFTP